MNSRLRPSPFVLVEDHLLPLQGFESGSSPEEQLNSLGRDPDTGEIDCLAARGCFNSPLQYSLRSCHSLTIFN